jgi:hypothetical protein
MAYGRNPDGSYIKRKGEKMGKKINEARRGHTRPEQRKMREDVANKKANNATGDRRTANEKAADAFGRRGRGN